jgi:hypothetical protein
MMAPRHPRLVRASVLLAAVVVPAGARAQALCSEPFATATFFEVAETIECNPGGAADPALDPFCLDEVSRGFGTRIADARLEGMIDGPGGFDGPAVVVATSVLNQRDWIGPAHGTIAVGGGQARFSGRLNLSAARAGVPLAPISGKWNGTKGLKAGGAFAGTFFIPFACPPESGLAGACYVRLDESGTIAGFEQAEVRDGVPLVKLEITFCGR